MGYNKKMKKEVVNMYIGIFLLLFLTGFLSAIPSFPSMVFCEGDCHVFNEDGSKCNNCFVQYIEAGDNNKIDSIGERGEISGDDELLETTFTGNKDMGSGMFSDQLNLKGGGNVYVRVWNAKDIQSSSFYGESDILEIDLPGERYSFENIYLDIEKGEKIKSSPKQNTRIDNDYDSETNVNSKMDGESENQNIDEKDYKENKSNQLDSEDEEEKKYKSWQILVLLGLFGATLFIMKKKRKNKFNLFNKKKRGENGEKKKD